MPYLAQRKKDLLKNNGLNDLLKILNRKEPIELAGDINYINYLIIKTWTEKNKKKYWIFALLVGTLICCVLEVYRRLIASHEKEAIKRNGDI